MSYALTYSIPQNTAFDGNHTRIYSIWKEYIIRDIGVFSMVSSDSQAMGRVGEIITRTWQVAHRMKEQRGALEGDSEYNDNNRIKRYIAKYTINPAITHGISDYVGSIDEG